MIDPPPVRLPTDRHHVASVLPRKSRRFFFAETEIREGEGECDVVVAVVVRGMTDYRSGGRVSLSPPLNEETQPLRRRRQQQRRRCIVLAILLTPGNSSLSAFFHLYSVVQRDQVLSKPHLRFSTSLYLPTELRGRIAALIERSTKSEFQKIVYEKKCGCGAAADWRIAQSPLFLRD